MNAVRIMSTGPVQLTKMFYPAIGQACRGGIVVCFVRGSRSCALDRDRTAESNHHAIAVCLYLKAGRAAVVF